MVGSRRAAAAAGAVTALVGAFAAGTAWGGREQPPPEVVAAPPGQVRPVSAELRPAESCESLLAWYVENSLDLVGPWGWFTDSPVVYELKGAPRWPGWGALDQETTVLGATRDRTASGPMPPAPAAPGMERATSSATGSNVQEAGVDEPDSVKTDGSLLVRISDDELVTWDVAGSRPERLGSVDLPADLATPELLLVGDRAVVIGEDVDRYDVHGTTTVLGVDLSFPEDPAIVDERVYDATLVTARQHGDVVRVVLRVGLPDLDFVDPGGPRTERNALRRNRQVVRESTIEDWLPSVRTDGRTSMLGTCADVELPGSYQGAGTVFTVGFAADAPDERSVTGLAAATEIAYASTDRLYFASGGTSWGPVPLPCCVMQRRSEVLPGGPLPPVTVDRVVPTDIDDGVTDIHAFRLDGTATSYVASGTVDGIVADRWAMDSAGGVLRVAVGPSVATGNFNSVVTFREDGDDLVELGRVAKLGVNEQIQSMRWFDTLAIMVTFRRVDPLYAIDLSDPARPRTLGKLKIPGFSSYLHPLGPRRILAVGELGGGAQAALFDLEDFAHPEQVAVVRYGAGTEALAGTDPRQFTWLPDRRIALTVVSKGWAGRTGYVSVLRVTGGELSNRLIEAEHGTEVADLRMLPLPSGRVVLVTGDGLRFLDGLGPR